MSDYILDKLLDKKDNNQYIFLNTLKRYITKSEKEYFSRKRQVPLKYFDSFFKKLYFLYDYRSYLEFNIKKVHNNIRYDFTIKKENGVFRKFIIPNLYLVLFFELIITNIIYIINKMNNKKELSSFLIFEKYFGYNHQVEQIGYNLVSKKYQELWQEFENKKENLISEYRYGIYTDIKDYYSTINHNNLINLLDKFFCHFLSNKEYDKYEIENLLHLFSQILFKISNYNNIGIPQGLLGSDYISVLYVWLIFFFNRSNYDINLENNIFNFNNSKIILYADDIFLFGKKEIDLYEDYFLFRKMLDEYKLELNTEKTTDVIESKEFKKNLIIDIEKIQKNSDKEEIKKLKTKVKNFIENSDNIDIKKYFKRIFKIKELSDNIDFLKLINNTIISANRGALDKNKKILTLINISEENFLNILSDVKSYINYKIWNTVFTTFVKKNLNLLSDNSLIKITEFLQKTGEGRKLLTILYHKLNIKDNPVIDGFLSNENLFKPYFEKNKFYGINNLFYTKKIDQDIEYKENLLGILLNDLFSINIEVTENFSNNYRNLIQNKKIGTHIKSKILDLAEVINSLLLIKNNSFVFYYKEHIFLADTFSLINLMFSIIFSIKDKKNYEFSISFNPDNFYEPNNFYLYENDKENNKREKHKLSLYFSEIENYLGLLFFLQKKRAKGVHKEKDKFIELPSIKVVSKYENGEYFLYDIEKLINLLFNILNNQIDKFNY